jgi:hypothetical protein
MRAPSKDPSLSNIRGYVFVLVRGRPESLIPSDYYKVALGDMAKWAMVKVNTLIILGEDTGKFSRNFIPIDVELPAANDPEFITRGFAYTKEMSMIGEIVRIVPAFLAP